MKPISPLLMVFALWQITNLQANTLARNEAILTLIQTRKSPGANLNGISLIDLDLSKVDIRGVKIRDAHILRVNLSGSNLTNADAENSNFFGSILIDTKFKNANLDGSQGLHKAIFQKCSPFPLNWLRGEYDKDNLDLQQLAKLLSTGYTVCQADYTVEELEQLRKFNLI